ncbi:MAG: RdgB/HAM1 family non-canonical purine NTP pyrophosphatase [Chloroflexi bacterium]|nr:MAG: RdgB/HAM1 family non-canonical purine NTP pyrophosphatase [Chloroflexota bacterium]
MTVRLLIASNNQDKIREFREIFADLPLTLTHPAAEGLTLEPEETGQTFTENAIIKAMAFARATGLLTLADDSGLEVDALGGEPGVHSARYCGTAKDDHAGRYRLVLQKLAESGVPWEQRTARYRCVVAVAVGDRLVGTVEGTVEGYIAYQPKGSGGFGYDPVFYVPEYNCTMAELTPAQKHAISHRGRAARAAIPLLRQALGL